MTTSFLLIALLGLGIGVALGLTGVGAGSVLTPALVLLGVRPAVAVGTSLLFSVLTKPVGAAQHLRQGTADLHVVRWLATGSLPAAVLSLVLVHTVIPSRVLLDSFTQHAIAAALVIVAIVLTLRLTNLLPRPTGAVPERRLVAVGVMVGVMVALTSVGSGSVAIAMLGVLTSLTVAQLVGTDMLHAALLAGVTAPFYLASGTVDVGLALGLAVGSIPGVVVGSRLAVSIPERFTRGTVVAAVWLVALKSL
jgi:uncharacterized membrane protein YfcA